MADLTGDGQLDDSLAGGKCNIKIHVDVPGGTKLASPLQDGCLWCQARGSATVLREEADAAAKVGVAQQWYDELDNLAFASANTTSELDDQQVGLAYPQGDTSAYIDCCVSTSPGTSEVLDSIPFVFLEKYTEKSMPECSIVDIIASYTWINLFV